MHFLCADWCNLSCHTVIKHFVLSLIKAFIYQAPFLYLVDSSCLLISQRLIHLHWLAQLKNDQFTNIYGRGGEGSVFIHIHLSVLLHHFNK